jgi:hypothetical protein
MEPKGEIAMDTVKVDIQKLQLLNDRIAQTIDALNQVRMSVHGIQHTQWSPFAQVSPYGFPQSPFVGYPQTFGQFPPTPYPTQFQPTPFGSPFSGLSHTSPQTMQYTQYNPYTQYTPYTTPYTNGISHTSFDPTWQSRQTTFPFVQHPYLNTSW